MQKIAVTINIHAAKLRMKIKKMEHASRVLGHPVRTSIYNFVQHLLKKFCNWFYTVCSVETQHEMQKAFNEHVLPY